MSKSIHFIGCGRLGKTIAKLIHAHDAGIMNGVLNSSIESSQHAIQFIGQGTALQSIEQLSPADIYFITTADDLIQTMAEQLTEKNILKPGAIIVHCSGSLSSDILQSAKKAGCLIASVHPVKSFANPTTAVKTFEGTFCSFEGDPQARQILKEIFEKIGGKFLDIDKTRKAQYHAAMVIANNYVTGLHYQATKKLAECGIDPDISKKLVSMMMNDSLRNLETLDHTKALTGPLQRGDIATINRHIKALQHDPTVLKIYKAIGLGTLPITPHNTAIKEKLEELFMDDTPHLTARL